MQGNVQEQVCGIYANTMLGYYKKNLRIMNFSICRKFLESVFHEYCGTIIIITCSTDCLHRKDFEKSNTCIVGILFPKFRKVYNGSHKLSIHMIFTNCQ